MAAGLAGIVPPVSTEFFRPSSTLVVVVSIFEVAAVSTSLSFADANFSI